MTNIITLFRPEGIWQSADHMITLKNGTTLQPISDATPKQLQISFPPLEDGPIALMAFAGLAEMSDGTPTLQWIEETLRGESRDVMTTLEHLKTRLNRDVGGSPYWTNPLILTGGIIEGDKQFYFDISNQETSGPRVTNRFNYRILEVDKPLGFIAGSGRFHVTPEDLELLEKTVAKKPGRWKQYSGLLAAVNRRIASHDPTVSPWCYVSFLSKGNGAQGMQFTKPGDPPIPFSIHGILAGIDISQMVRLLVDQAQSGMPIDQLNLGTASDKSIRPRP